MTAAVVFGVCISDGWGGADGCGGGAVGLSGMTVVLVRGRSLWARRASFGHNILVSQCKGDRSCEQSRASSSHLCRQPEDVDLT